MEGPARGSLVKLQPDLTQGRMSSPEAIILAALRSQGSVIWWHDYGVQPKLVVDEFALSLRLPHGSDLVERQNTDGGSR